MVAVLALTFRAVAAAAGETAGAGEEATAGDELAATGDAAAAGEMAAGTGEAAPPAVDALEVAALVGAVDAPDEVPVLPDEPLQAAVTSTTAPAKAAMRAISAVRVSARCGKRCNTGLVLQIMM